jgi:formylglycine-generating enzyme required for sulfatase activity
VAPAAGLKRPPTGWRKARRWTWFIGLFLLAGAGVWGAQQHAPPARCPDGLTPGGARCCAGGQAFDAAKCAGKAQTCSRLQVPLGETCSLHNDVVNLPGGTLSISIDDWDLLGNAQAEKAVQVRAFGLDRAESSFADWQACADRGICRNLVSSDLQLPVTRVSAFEAQTFCQYKNGRLPTSHEWLWAARGPAARRYPWGPFGLVCRRAVYGLVNGPCAHGGDSPDWPGSRPDGATPDGVLDLAGNVAEWTLDPTGDAPRVVARGGSFRAHLAAELKSLAVRETTEAAPDIGVRCAYDR